MSKRFLRYAIPLTALLFVATTMALLNFDHKRQTVRPALAVAAEPPTEEPPYPRNDAVPRSPQSLHSIGSSQQTPLKVGAAQSGTEAIPPTTEEHRQTAIFAALAAKVSTSPPDNAWKTKTETMIFSALAPGSVPGATVESVRCGGSVCEAKIRTADRQKQISLGAEIANIEPFASVAGVFYKYETDEGISRTTAYLVKDPADIAALAEQ